MVIVHISIYPQNISGNEKTSGVANYERDLVANIPYRGGDAVYVICQKANGYYQEYEEGGFRIIRCFDKGPLYLYQILKAVRRINPDIVHIQQELALYGNIVTAYEMQILILALGRHKCVTTLHGVVSLKDVDKNFIAGNFSTLPTQIVKLGFYTVYKPLCLLTEKVVVHEMCFKKTLIEEYGVKEDKIHVIPHMSKNLIPINKERARQMLNLKQRMDIVLFMGYATGYKGIDLLIEGFSEYAQKNKDAFLIIGAGKHPRYESNIQYISEYKRLMNKAVALIPVTSYRWVGYIPEEQVCAYYSAADVSVYPYTVQIASSGPMSIAISYGKPFLASTAFSSFISNKDALFEKNKKSLAQALHKYFCKKTNLSNYTKILMEERTAVNVGYKTYKLYESMCGLDIINEQ